MDEKTASLQVIKLDYIDQIPYLMHTMDIDSVFEIVTYGRLSIATETDTINRYLSRGSNTISQNFKSLMCCYYTYHYDSLGMLSKKTVITDYRTHYNFNYLSHKNSITVLEEGSFEDSRTHVYTIKDKRLQMQQTTSTLDSSYVRTTKYRYNSHNQLTEELIEAKNHPYGEFDVMRIIKRYDWQGAHLKTTVSTQYDKEDRQVLKTKTTFDSIGFPIRRVYTRHKDTLCKTILVKIKSPK